MSSKVKLILLLLAALRAARASPRVLKFPLVSCDDHWTLTGPAHPKVPEGAAALSNKIQRPLVLLPTPAPRRSDQIQTKTNRRTVGMIYNLVGGSK